ncbi:tRNA uridine-5-carboxymethylaminomethyl(34) synthesis GTPase MnmE [Pacificimonas sp. WHA3]|uniref:tRNA modification GTPase MnmE n=1 Tax=Pacificimonas pallii TaxID=2827236 RepID=A0ABS6SBH9_9SPHN|nr:tRNA uridine-5-carboxymethylaminomethyl(34) synthesis GTPase MnmE [Pacificimonas pallii]MBV7255774.1 tRNA uridine-5-carboxymethylaminomethyl(34) synthesis GTPase MnmE [Pacificimonas pallii]
MRDDTIFALSSGQLPAAVAIIRISGQAALDALTLLTSRNAPVPRQASLMQLRDPADATALDDALAIWFPGPASFTGEDILELQVTGSVALVEHILALLGKIPGYRSAAPGEFARRAFLNGKIDLTEAEGLAALIDAETESQRRQAMMAAGGTMRMKAESWRERLLSIRADTEAALDFADAEEDVAERLAARAHDDVLSLREEMQAVLSRAAGARRIRRGVTIAVTGPPNSGKSSLVNMLSQSDVTIVSDRAGTTRDAIDVPLDVHGYRVTLVDTAGLREVTDDAIEEEGMRRARVRAADADFRLRTLGDEEEGGGISDADFIVRTKTDLGRNVSPGEIGISNITGEGMDALLGAIADRIAGGVTADMIVTTSARQTELLARTVDALVLAEAVDDPVLLAEHLRDGALALGALTGFDTADEILGQIFSRFCVGK